MKKVILLLTILFVFNSVHSQFGTENILTNSYIYNINSVEPLDFDNDGDQDIIVCGQSEISWFKNLGNGDFSQKIILHNSSSNYRDLKIIHVNNDGLKDISFKCGLGRLFIYNNTSNVVIPGSNVTYNTFRTYDFDGNGKDDFICSDGTNGSGLISIRVYEYDSLNNDFQLILQHYSTNSYASSSLDILDYSDVNNDGYKDFVYSFSNSSSLYWIENLGNSTFDSEVLLLNTPYLATDNDKFYTFDIDNDSDNDIIMERSEVITIWENLGNGVFSHNYSNSTGAQDVSKIKFSDIDNDGLTEMMFSLNLSSITNNPISIYEYQSNMTFTQNDVYFDDNISHITPTALIDLDQDNQPDILGYSDGNGVNWIKNDNSFNFSTNVTTISTMSQRNYEVEKLDFDNDDDIDIFLLGDEYDLYLMYYENLGNGNFAKEKYFINSFGNIGKLVFNDIDNDSFIDLILMDKISNKLHIYKNNGGNSITYFQTKNLNSIPTIYDVSIGDLNADGADDIVLITNTAIYWCENISSYFANPISLYGVLDQQNIRAIDADSDGDIDIFTSCFDASINYSNSETIYYFENQGNNTYLTTIIDNAISPMVEDIDVHDFNNDGLIDVSFYSSDEIGWFQNLGNGNFSALMQIDNQLTNISSITSGDVDFDGFNDILVSSLDNDALYWFKNDGNNGFSASLSIPYNGNGPKQIICADLDNDFDLEIIVPTYYDDKLSWFENYTDPPFILKGEVYIDNNQNGINDIGDVGSNLIQIITTPQNAFSYTFPNGKYSINCDTASSGTYQVYPGLLPNWGITSDSIIYNVSFDNAPLFDSLDFGVYPTIIEDSIDIQTTGSFPRCDDIINYWININNLGTTVPSGVISIELDPLQTFIDSEIAPDSIIGQVVYWHYDSLFYFDNEVFQLEVLMPDFNYAGDTLTISSSMTVLDMTGNTIYQNTDTLDQILVCAYDPNDKTASPEGIGTEGFIPLSTNYIEYLVRFQNTGTDTAHTVIIKDQLDDNLNWTSIIPLACSHNMFPDVNSTGEVTFTFDNIMLPDSNVNEIQSHGFVLYRIDLLPNLLNGTEINNTANIYFDNNPAVITNTKKHTLDICIDPLYTASAIPDVQFSSSTNTICVADTVNFTDLSTNSNVSSWDFGDGNIGNGTQTGYSYGTSGFYDITLTVTSAAGCSNSLTEVSFIEVLPTPIINFNVSANNNICTYSDLITIEATPTGGIYSGFNLMNNEFSPNTAGEGNHVIYYSFTNSDQCTSIDSIVFIVDLCLGVDNNSNGNTSISPNPFNDYTTLSLANYLTEEYNIIIYDALGRIVYRTTEINDSKILIYRNELAEGVYLLRITNINNGKEVFNTKLIIE